MAKSLKQTVITWNCHHVSKISIYKDEKQGLHTHTLHVWYRGSCLHGDTDYGCHARHLFASSYTVFVEHIDLRWLKVNIKVHTDHTARPARLKTSSKEKYKALIKVKVLG